MDISYIINQLGEDRENYFNAVSPPIIQTSNFAFPNVEIMRKSLEKEREVPAYTRGMNPTVEILRKKLAALENAEDALVFPSCVFHKSSNKITLSDIPFDVVRFYIGLEEPDILIKDLVQALLVM